MAGVTGKIALITGGASGLGAASGRMLAGEGATVILADIDRAQGEAVASDIGEAAEYAHLDVSQESEWQALISDIVKRHGRLDVLVNNAGIVVVATIEDTSQAQLDRVRAVNFDGPFFGCKHAIPAMSAGGGGSIINMSSAAAFVGTPAYAAYSATKGALRSLTGTVAVHCKQRGNGVRCNSIHPGGMDTPMVQNLAEGDVSPLAVELTAVGKTSDRFGHPDDVAAAVLYLASDESQFCNGSALSVDDGMAVGGFGLPE
ncbi:MAG: SDR family oxidoreductase [Pseudomonadota bacterium]